MKIKAKTIAVFSVAAVMAAMVLVRSSEVQGQSASVEEWKVEIDMLSGLPNPTFTLDAAEAARVRQSLAAAPQVRAAALNERLRPAILGYRGMVLTVSDRSRVTEEVELSGTRILRAANREVLDGRAVALERYLFGLAQAKSAVTPQQAAVVAPSIP